MKNLIIKTCDFIAYILFAIIFISSLIIFFTGGVGQAIVFFVIGWIGACLLSGAWFCLSAIASSTAETNKLLKQLIDKQEVN